MWGEGYLGPAEDQQVPTPPSAEPEHVYTQKGRGGEDMCLPGVRSLKKEWPFLVGTTHTPQAPGGWVW